MHPIDLLLVTRNKRVKKRFPQVGGVGGRRILGEETGKKGLGTEELGFRALEMGGGSFGPRICDCLYFARGAGNYLQTLFLLSNIPSRTWLYL